MSDVVTRIGERLRHMRKSRGLSQEQLAERSSLHTNYIGQIERGEKNLTIETLHKITRGLEVTLEEVFKHIDPTGEPTDELSEIIHMLSLRSKEDQAFILQLIRSLLNWENEKKNP
ncbi:helix-turn-helix domain-containing protein [Paenibacillus sp. FSL K6-2524]|uniref:helix-turn-helix domain-containing protein n=1 Tax=Paenibacillus sp. FSL K6-2524 TaxID=2954516 RepID=UPI0030F940FD